MCRHHRQLFLVVGFPDHALSTSTAVLYSKDVGKEWMTPNSDLLISSGYYSSNAKSLPHKPNKNGHRQISKTASLIVPACNKLKAIACRKSGEFDGIHKLNRTSQVKKSLTKQWLRIIFEKLALRKGLFQRTKIYIILTAQPRVLAIFSRLHYGPQGFRQMHGHQIHLLQKTKVLSCQGSKQLRCSPFPGLKSGLAAKHR